MDTAPRVLLDTAWTISDFFQLWQQGRCIKPLIQRRIRWDEEKCSKFLHYLIRVKNSGNPIHVNRTIRVSDSIVDVYTVFDGNNRSNCILDFVLAPLAFHTKLIPASLSLAGKERLMRTPLKYLQSSPMNLVRWCGVYRGADAFLKKIEALQTAVVETVSEEMNTQFDEMLQSIGELSFLDIKLKVTVWDNLTSKQMCDLYHDFNHGTVVLSKQELLASSTFHTRYFPQDLHDLFAPLVEWKRNYYGEMSRSERLQLEEVTADSLSTFEVLTSFQMHLHSQFGTKLSNGFIDDYSSNDKNLVFELYQELKLPMEEKCPEMSHFLTRMLSACELVHQAYHSLYEAHISFSRRFKLKPYPAKVLILFVMLHPEGWADNGFHAYLRRVCAYHDLVEDLAKKEDHERFLRKDALSKLQGKFAHNTIRDLSTTGAFSTEPTLEDLSELSQVLIRQDIQLPQKSRKNWKTNTLKMMSMTAFFNYRVPSMQKQVTNAVDHIVPFSQRHPASLQVDICRLGNLTVIPSKINTERSVKPISDEWVKKNGFKYQEYPSEADYHGMVVAGRLENDAAFTDMCERRERMYVEDLLRMCE